MEAEIERLHGEVKALHEGIGEIDRQHAAELEKWKSLKMYGELQAEIERLRKRELEFEEWERIWTNKDEDRDAEIERLNTELEKGAERLSDMRAAAGKMGIERARLEAENERLRALVDERGG